MWFLILVVVATLAYFLIKLLTGNPSDGASATGGSDAEAVTQATSGSEHTGALSAAVAGSAAMAGTAALNTAAQASVTSVSVHDLPNLAVITGDDKKDAQEMIKILNLAAPDAGRLGISREALEALRSGDRSGAPVSDELSGVVEKLRQMLR